MTKPEPDYDEIWRKLKSSLRVGDLLHGRVHSHNAWWLNVDIGAPLLANLDAADLPTDMSLTDGDPVDVVVKSFDDLRRQPRVSAQLDALAGPTRQRQVPKALRGAVLWPPPVENGVSAREWKLQRNRS